MENSPKSHSHSSKPLHNNEKQNQKEEEEQSFTYAMQLADSVAMSMAMYTAVELGIFDMTFTDLEDMACRLIAYDIRSRYVLYPPKSHQPFDEADVFLEERSLHELERTMLVSVFLRKLEYFTVGLKHVISTPFEC